MRDMTPERECATEVQTRYLAALQRIREDRDLTDEARRRRIAGAWAVARSDLDKLQTEERARLARRERDLERQLFGLGGTGTDGAAQAISARDAQDRASRLTSPEESAELLRRAEQNGDHVLARAIAYHALQQSRSAMFREAVQQWDDVLRNFVETRPHVTPIVEELAAIERLGERQVLGPYSLAQPHVQPQDINSVALPA